MLNTSDFLDIDDAALKKIIGHDSVEAQEIVIYERAVEWAKEKLRK